MAFPSAIFAAYTALKKGIWVGGVVPLGYRVVDRKLVVATIVVLRILPPLLWTRSWNQTLSAEVGWCSGRR